MKDKFLKLLMIATLLVFMLVGCDRSTDNTTDTTKLSTETVTDTEAVVESELAHLTETMDDNIATISDEIENIVIEVTTEKFNYTEFNRVAHFRVANLPEKLINGEYTGNNSVFVQRYLEKTESGAWDAFYLTVWPAGNMYKLGLDLKNMTDEEIGRYVEGTPNYESLQRIETDDSYKVLIEYNNTIDTQKGKGYDLYINDYKTEKVYVIKLERVEMFYDSAQMLSILETFELLE